jgi:phosphoadenosine phosphosulfate reductase
MSIQGNAVMALKEILQPLSLLERLHYLVQTFQDEIVFSTSFGLEDQVISHLIFKNQLPIRVFTLDTGRQFQETYDTWQRTLDLYQGKIEVYFPDNQAITQLVQQQGVNGFYESVENRQACCGVRKVELLKRALSKQRIWITGIRAAQSANRSQMPFLEWDDSFQLIKFHPLMDWTFEQVKSYVHEQKIPYNPLHDKGFVSIGCAPCTRAIEAGEDFRAGRWWWEMDAKKECGLHIVPKKQF